MTVKEMFDQLKSKFEYVAPLTLPTEQKPGLSGPYIVNVIERNGDVVADRTLRIYIKDLNMTTEEVLFIGFNPLTPIVTPEPSFAQKVESYIQTLVNAGTYDYTKIEDVNATALRALVSAYKVNIDGTLSKTTLIIYEQADGTLAYKEAMI